MSKTEVTEKILDLLNKSGVEFTHIKHPPVRTSEEAAKIRGTGLETGVKAMIVKYREEYAMFILPANKKIDWKKLKKILGVSKVSFAPVDDVEEMTGVKVGGVPPFGNVLGIKTYFDKGILDIDELNFNIGSREHSVSMKSKDLVDLVEPEMEEFAA